MYFKKLKVSLFQKSYKLEGRKIKDVEREERAETGRNEILGQVACCIS